MMSAAAPASAEATIVWRLENPFRLFRNPEHTRLHAEAFAQLTAAERKMPILSVERRLEEKFGGRGWAASVFNDTCYDQAGNRYTACKDYVQPRSHRIIVGLKEGTSSGLEEIFGGGLAEGAVCTWHAKPHGNQMPEKRTAPCKQSVTLDIPYPAGALVTVTAEGTEAAPPADIKVRDVLIVGMGDSFAAGEGNPDFPVRFDDSHPISYGKIDIAATKTREMLDGYPAREGAWKTINTDDFDANRARWWDRECHRSLYSHQLRVALQLAIENPKRAVTFISFACSGAEIPEGILLAKPVRECTPGQSFKVPAQISALSQELCQSVVNNAPMPQAVINRMPELRTLSEDEMRITRCLSPDHKPAMKRKIDLVLMSVGGNDVGFVPVVSDSILSQTSIYRRVGGRMASVYGPEEARKRLDLIQKRFDGLRFAMEVVLGVRSERGGGTSRVILTGYPNMGYGADGVTACGGTGGLEVFPPFQLDGSKVGKGEEFTKELNAQLARIAGRSWTYVDSFRDDFRPHGLCASKDNGPADLLGFPRFQNGAWAPFKPSEYAAYTPRQRWFRTPNDAFLTSNMHAGALPNFGANCAGIYTFAARKLALRYWTPFQVFLASTFGGAFHPTAEGHADMADRMMKAARGIIDGRN